ncbi:hypothetical protein ALC62_07129, partial [Cyphomyrmex costatus]
KTPLENINDLRQKILVPHDLTENAIANRLNISISLLARQKKVFCFKRDQSFYRRGIHLLPERWGKCIQLARANTLIDVFFAFYIEINEFFFFFFFLSKRTAETKFILYVILRQYNLMK